MSTNVSPPAGSPPPAAAAALFERHEAGLRVYLSGLQGAEATRVETVIQAIRGEVAAQMAFEDDPTVWMFAEARRRVLTGGARGDFLGAGESAGVVDDDAVAGEDAAIAVHRAFGRLTNKQQEVVRLKFQFGFHLAELARITGVSFSGASGLLHSAVERVCRAAGATLSLGEDRRIDVRLTAYALDELEPAERQGFAESVSDGKALLESSDTIRKVGAQLTRILASGAPIPQRRRKRQAAGWRSPAVLFGVPGVLVAGGLAWYFLSDGDEAKARREAVPWTVNGDSTVSARTRRGSEREEGARSSGGGAAADLSGRDGRPSRRGETDWKDHSSDSEHPERDPNADTEKTTSESGTDSESTPSMGGTRSPGTRTGETAKNDPTAEARGQYGSSDRSPSAAREATPDSDDTTAPKENAGSDAAPSGSGSTAKLTSAGGMKPMQPDRVEKKAAPGEGREAGRQATPTEREPRAVKPSRQPAPGIWPKTAEARAAAMAQHASLEKPTPENATEAPLAARVEMAPSPWKPDKLLVRVTVKAKPVAPPARPPASVVFAIDVSQSMAGPNRLPLVEEGIRLLAERLRAEDRVSVVTYAASAKEMLPSAPLGAKALELRNCLAELEAGGQTNGDEGLRLAYAIARRARVAVGPNVVVLCTDGNFNLGETDEQVLAACAQQAAAEGIKLSVFGFGRSDRNDLRLELLATKGGGRSCYVNTREDAEQLLAGQIDGLLTPVASQVALRVAFDSAQVDAVARLDRDADADAPQSVDNLLPGRSLSALYEITPIPGRTGTGVLGEWEANFRRTGSAKPERLAARLEGKIEDWTHTSADFRFVAAWAEFSRILKTGTAGATEDLDRLENWVQRALPDDNGGYRTELLENIAAAREAAGEVGR